MDINLCEQLGNFCRNPYYNGCYKKCPCILINNCSYYVNDFNKTERLKAKILNENYMKEIYEYLNTYFRIDYYNSECFGNG